MRGKSWRQLQAPDGRGGGIRTHGLFVPNEARYQAALRPDILRCPMSIERQNPSMISHHRARGYLTFPHSGFSRAIRQKLPQRTAHPSVFQQRKSFSYKRSLLLSRLPSPRKRIFDIPHSGFSRAIREKFSQMAAHPPVFQQRKSFSYKRSLLLSRKESPSVAPFVASPFVASSKIA